MQIAAPPYAPDISLAKTLVAALLGVALLAIPTETHAQEDAAITPAPTPAAPAAPKTPAACGPLGLARVAEVSRGGVVRVTTHTGWGAGFLIDENHVATHFRVVERPLSLRVHAGEGVSIGARVVAVDPFERIAILQLDAPLPGKPIELATTLPEIGSEVVGIGVGLDFGSPGAPQAFPAHRRGVVTDRRDDLLATDALFSFHHWGGPLLDCEGRAVGVIVPSVSRPDAWEDPIGRAIPAEKLRQTLASVGQGAPPRGPWALLGLETTLAGQFERGRGFVGGTFGFPLLFAEQWEFVPRFGAFAEVPENVDLPISRTSTLRLTPDVRFGYRIPLASAPTTASLVPTIGAGWNVELTQAETYKLSLDDPTCTNQTAGCSFRMIKTEQESWRTSPLVFAGLTAHVHILTIGYELRIVTVPDVKVIHQLSLGVSTF